jgi:hypothetical protein
MIFAWFCGILCCRVQIFWHLFTILRPKAFWNRFIIWLVRGSEIFSETCVSRFMIFAWFCGILCCRVQIFWHLFTISGPKAIRNHFSIWLVRGVRNSEPPVSRFMIFAWFCGILCCRVQIFWQVFTILRPKAFWNHFCIWLVRGSEILNPVSRDL